MKIIIAPAKRMCDDIPYLNPRQKPVFIRDSVRLMQVMKQQTEAQLRHILNCSAAIAHETKNLFANMQLYHNGVPALLAYQGIQYTYMAPQVFTDEYFEYVEKHVRILSGFYGILRPLDGVVPYRLELNNKLIVDGMNLYQFWNKRLYEELTCDDHAILDLASVQYGSAIRRYCGQQDRYVKCYFMEEEAGSYREKGVYVKMARGEMVRYLACIEAKHIEDAKGFCQLGYTFQETMSTSTRYVFVRTAQKQGE